MTRGEALIALVDAYRRQMAAYGHRGGKVAPTPTKRQLPSTNPTKRGPHRIGYLYVLDLGEGHYKLGRTLVVRDRLSDYNSMRLEEIDALHVIEAREYAPAEKNLHRALCRFRVRREIFRLPDEILAQLLQVQRVDTGLEFIGMFKNVGP